MNMSTLTRVKLVAIATCLLAGRPAIGDQASGDVWSLLIDRIETGCLRLIQDAVGDQRGFLARAEEFTEILLGGGEVGLGLFAGFAEGGDLLGQLFPDRFGNLEA